MPGLQLSRLYLELHQTTLLYLVLVVEQNTQEAVCLKLGLVETET